MTSLQLFKLKRRWYEKKGNNRHLSQLIRSLRYSATLSASQDFLVLCSLLHFIRISSYKATQISPCICQVQWKWYPVFKQIRLWQYMICVSSKIQKKQMLCAIFEYCSITNICNIAVLYKISLIYQRMWFVEDYKEKQEINNTSWTIDTISGFSCTDWNDLTRYCCFNDFLFLMKRKLSE